MFDIVIKKLYWIDGSDDNKDDFCLHGDVEVNIGDERYEESCAVSAAGLYMLKSVTNNHIIYENNQMLPCCGHFLLPDDNDETITIIGCGNGVDWSVLHDENSVSILTEKGTKIALDMEAYRRTVFDFVDKIEQYYQKCSPKNMLSLDEFSQNAYRVFLNEWKKRRSS